MASGVLICPQSLNIVNGFICFCPSARERSKPHFSFDSSKCLSILRNILSSYFEDLACCHFSPHCSVNVWCSDRSGFIIPSLPAWAVRISKLDALPAIADPKAISLSPPCKLPMDTSASFSSPSYVSDLTEETFPLSWLHLPRVHLLSLKVLFLSLACFFEDQCLNSS